jgi:hypothetical protein
MEVNYLGLVYELYFPRENKLIYVRASLIKKIIWKNKVFKLAWHWKTFRRNMAVGLEKP